MSAPSSQRLSRPLIAIAALGLALILFLAVNVLAGAVLRTLRVDLTEDRVHTLSQGTISALSKIDEPIRLRLYFSAKAATRLAQIRVYGQHVKDLLEEYRARSGGKLQVEIIDPEPFSPAEDEAAQMGVRAVPIEGGETFYFGLVGTNQADGREVIPYFALDRQNFVEYDLTRLITNLNRIKKPVVGLMTDLPLAYGPGGMMAAMRGQSRPFAIYEDLSKQFDIRAVPMASETIDPEIQVLILAHPGQLEPGAQYAIDQFVLRGGRLLVFVDPFSELTLQAQAASGQRGAAVESSNLEPLFAKWGIALEGTNFVADRKLAQKVAFMDNGQQRTMGYVGWLHLEAGNFDAKDVTLAQLKTINLASAGAIKALPGATTQFQPLITSSDDAMLVDKEKIATRPDPVALMRDFQPSGQRYVLAARVTGSVETAFPKGPPGRQAQTPGATPPKVEPAQLMTAKVPINVVVIADTDILDDKFWVQTADLFGQRIPMPTADNGNFVLGLVDNLAGSDDLIGLRARPPVSRPFTLVEDMRAKAEQRFLAEEKALQDKLAATEKRLSELQLQGKTGAAAAAMTPAQIEEINAFQRERAETRMALREVQRKLRADIDRLDGMLKFFNFALVPILLALFAIGLSIHQSRQRAARIARLKAADRAA